MREIYLSIMAALLLTASSFGQVTVTVTNPSNTTPNLAASYTSLANAVAAVNLITAMSGPVILTCAAGTETAPAGGYSVTLVVATSATKTITFTTSGTVTLTASSALTVGNLNDAIFKLIGADFITISGFTMKENAANTINTPAGSNNMTEWGIALLRASTTNGAQNNTIQNNTISLNIAYWNSFGIYSNARHTATAPTTANDATAVTGSNLGNKVYGNSISNVMMGITFIGTATAAFQDAGNDIGGTSLATGNTISNWGGNTPLSSYASNSGTSYCIFSNHQTADNISYNTINSGTVGSGVSTTFSGIRKDYTTTAPTGTFTSTISYNTITMSSAFTGGNFECIRSQGMSLSTGTMNITNNNILNTSITATSTSAFGGILCVSACGTLNVTNNIIRGHTTVSSGGYTGISNSGTVVNIINITGNKIGDAIAGALMQTTATGSQLNAITNTGGTTTTTLNMNNNSLDGFSVVTYGFVILVSNRVSGNPGTVNMNNNQLGTTTGSLITFSGAQISTFFGVFNGPGSSSLILSMQNNDFRGITHLVTTTAPHYYITNDASSGLSSNISNNTFTNISENATGNTIFILDASDKPAGASTVINNNSIVTGYNRTAAAGNVDFIDCGGLSVNGSTNNITNNNFSNITVIGSSQVYGIAAYDGVSSSSGSTVNITGNTISNINAASGTVYGIYLDYSAAASVTSNSISSINSNAGIYGLDIENTNGQGIFNVYSNTINNLSSTVASGHVRGILVNSTSVPTFNIYGNTIANLASAGLSNIVSGVMVNNGQAINIYSNTINNLANAGNSVPLAAGLNILAGTTLNIYGNNIHTISATANFTPTAAVAAGIRVVAGTTANVYNNFVSNLTAPNINYTDAIRGIDISSSTASSNYNLYYNSVYINATSAGADFGTSGIYHLTNATGTTSALNMIDNIIVNTSTAKGAGVTAAYRRSDAMLTNFASASDYNLFYAGTPAATRLIFYDGTNADQSLAAYQTRVSTRDANSISLMPNFTSATDLHLTSVNCRINARGTPVAGITTDIDAATRSVTTPDIGADEFNPATSSTLAGSTASAVCEDKTVSVTGTTYLSNGCDLIARVLPSGGSAVAGKVNVCVTLDATQQYFNGEPYVQRHFDIEPTTSNQTTTSATITLYFTNAEFVQYNTNNQVWPKLPTATLGNADPNRANVKVTQFHGAATTSPSSPGNYPGVRVLIAPSLANVFWNGIFWSITFDVAGFSGFYVHTNDFNAPLPVSINYFTGNKQGNQHLLNWKVTCNSTPTVTMTLERSADSRNFSAINAITADAARCNQPFDHTDANPLTGMNYYRLKMEDAAGKISYSSIVALLNAVKGFDIISIAPNPVTNGNFTLNMASAQASKMELVIFDMQGRLINRQTVSVIAGFNNIPMNVGNLSAGTYTIKSSMATDQSKVIRFVKQ